MIIKAIKTHKIIKSDNDLLKLLDQYVDGLKEESILVIASKIVAITQGRMVNPKEVDVDALIKKEADFFIDKNLHKSNLFITLKNNILTFSSGIDESNGNGYLILWPEDPQKVANKVRNHLMRRFNIEQVGVIITDMTALPMRWGVIGGAIAYSGFKPLKDLRGKPDIFGKEYKYTKVGILNGLSAAASVVMGEGAEQTPLAIIEDLDFIEFVDKNPSRNELESLIIKLEEDMYGPLFKNAPWQKGGS
ncbi:hypothetical protein A3F00_04485 [Candidatus Daviesbacteria bacterium RIFCSPHIGHO2_12_FULL_37_11]|uniref:Coenzyme F420:L-glutamate ligase-like domain-containing protein n=1 Tax=Candidatus Daviesbacteria bacterium RIFCSPHIGHO2_12_FULL_37_11 TaxID=1797777 RepID=A0A1F5KAP9_9BACT|nr:MAG: hypothetical protein A2111_02250 [Candidatus Daviesbacteria bacterium GWA1_38_6]OGE16158.1 MAG: hypothetical protein A2769_03655 [Candidatus Daviesbacteria bacterium RIFCSPHIGHO2_01_FULL_37_27]OGE37681.1 MAG: hypothetical protein A3F00_04485 [Candidatus Daviesbacteria bacterium RIFCSPHIGHO2_12_FULL_37_11]OGE45436.1 MAG: hypothetical protein A3B39_04885 [Candidatus Daviesbacteria bacterium RIFCSPLOWO2_01_FULL_37_10]